MAEPQLLSEEYSVLVETDLDAYDFYAHLCAYCTGFDAEGEDVRPWSDMFYKEMGIKEDRNPFSGYVVDRMDGDGVWSPCAVWPSRKYDDEHGFPAPYSVGIFFCKEPTAELIAKIKERSKAFFEKVWEKGKVEGFRLVTHRKYGEEKAI